VDTLQKTPKADTVMGTTLDLRKQRTEYFTPLSGACDSNVFFEKAHPIHKTRERMVEINKH